MFGLSRGIYSFVARMYVDIQLLKLPFSAINSSALLGGVVLFHRDDDISLFEQINAFNSRCDHQHPFCKSGIWSVPTFSQSETKDAIYIAQEKYTRCGAVCPGTFTPVLTLRVTCSHFGVKPAQRPGSARRGCPARDPLSGAAPAVLPGAGVDKRQFS